MQPKTDVKFNKRTFDRIKRTIRNMSLGKRGLKEDSAFAMKMPDEIGIQLTYKCNLRCKHCFQWNNQGFFKHMDKTCQNEEIRIDLVERILNETSEIKSNLYLWGGEPLCYSEFNSLADVLEKDPRWTVFCTNGIEIEKKLDSILKISSNLVVLTSIEGYEYENDIIRGKGTYKKVMKSINLLLDLKRKGLYKGEISVNCVINENMIGKLYDFAEMFENIGINTLYFCFPWYISKESSKKMDIFFKDRFSWLRILKDNYKPSWHSYTYHLSPNIIEKLIEDLKKINSKIWKIRMRYQPALEIEEIRGFIQGSEKPAQNKSKCIGITNRMNILPNGKITICKLFPEFEIGDMNTNSVYDLWNSEKFNKARERLSCELMPVCSKCVLLYLHGV